VVCSNRGPDTWRLLERSGHFAVNVLTADQIDVAERFVGVGQLQGDARYGNDDRVQTESGVWVLNSAAAALVCGVDEVILRHSHALILGRVHEVFHQTDADPTQPLVYWQGQFASLTPTGRRPTKN